MTSGNSVNKGSNVFIRKIANKFVDVQKINEEVSSFLDSIPEWADYYQTTLKAINEIESRPLGQD
jgi:hypothetical protein